MSTRVGGRDYGATVTAWFSVSYDPPTMLVSLFELSRIAEAVEESGTWALSLLNREQEQTAKWLSSPGAPVEGLFNQVPHHRGPLTDAPILDGAIAWFELRTVDVQRAATHQLFVGRVLSQGRDAASPEPRSADPFRLDVPPAGALSPLRPQARARRARQECLLWSIHHSVNSRARPSASSRITHRLLYVRPSL